MSIKTICLAALLSGVTFTGNSQSTIQFSTSSYTVAESAGTVRLVVQRAGDTNTAVTVDFATADGTATNAIKYTAVSGTLAFGAGETNKFIVVPILNEGFVEGIRSFRVFLSNPAGGAALGTRSNATVNITDNDFGIQFQFDSFSVAEDAGAVLVRIVRDDDGILPVTVDLSTSDMTAANGVDYAGMTNTLFFASQERLKLVAIPILNNNLKQPDRTFRVALANPVGASLGSQTTATVTIVDNDQGFRFESPTYTVVEDAGAAFINVLRGTDDTNSVVTVDYQTANLGATDGVDYLGSTNTLTFAPREISKRIIVPILNNGVKQSGRNFRLTLSNPTAGTVLGSPTNSTVLITDNDPGVRFDQSTYTNAWGSGGRISVTVLRGNDLALGPISVDYATSNLTAVAGQDYQAISGTLRFQENETVKTLTVPLLRDRAAAGAKSFRVTLSNPTGGATLGTAIATVFIEGMFFTVAPPFDTALRINREAGVNILAWNGGGQLQRADSPLGPWQSLVSATSPFAVESPIPTTFYRVTRPRPVNVYVPSSYDEQTALPLVILLHGYGGSGITEEAYMKFRPLAEDRGFLYCYPDSMMDRDGSQFWNATDTCCDLYDIGVDDAGYLRNLIEEINGRFAVDRKRVYLIGHSNGGFMSYRMACESADLIAGIASLAGTTFLDPGGCAPSEPVNILHIHGTGDGVIFYAGGAFTSSPFLPPYPGALQTIQLWAGYNGASSPAADAVPSMDLVLDVSGPDTVVTRYTNAPPGGAVELWTINNGSHTPTLSSEFSPRIIDWLFAHPKP